MTDESLQILWRGSDPAKFTALQAALRNEEIQFWHTQVYDPAGGFLSSRPYYLEAVPGFEIRVHAADLARAKDALEWVQNERNHLRATTTDDALELIRELPDAWDSKEATAEAWSGHDDGMAEYLASALRENGIPSHVPDEPGNRTRLCVRPVDVARAREIILIIIEGVSFP